MIGLYDEVIAFLDEGWIRFLGNGGLWFRPYGGHFGKEPECRPSPK